MKIRILAIIAIAILFAFASRNMMVDDGLIYARFFQNMFSGYGLVFNPGESINSLTSPFFSYVMLAVIWLLHGHIVFAEHLVFGLALIGACILADFLIPYAGIAVVTTAYFWSLIGLESSLFLFLIMLVVKAYNDRRYDWLPVLLILTTLTRFEGGLLIPIIGYLLWKERRFPRIASIIAASLIAVGYLFLNHHLYHSFLAHSASSKFGQAFSGYWGRWPTAFLRIHVWAFRGPTPAFRRTFYLIPLILYFGYKGWRELRTTRINDVIAPFWLGLTLFYVLCNIPNYHWYYAPLIFVAILYAVQGVPKTHNATIALLVIIGVSGISNLFLANSFRPNQDYINIANWINANTPENASVESIEIGQIGWSTHRHIIDILGLTYPKNADHIAHKDAVSWLAEDKPDYVVIHQPLDIWEEVTASNPNYEKVPYHSGSVYLLQRKPGPWQSSTP